MKNRLGQVEERISELEDGSFEIRPPTHTHTKEKDMVWISTYS